MGFSHEQIKLSVMMGAGGGGLERASLFSWRRERLFFILVSVNRHVLQNCSVHHYQSALREKWTAKILNCVQDQLKKTIFNLAKWP